MTASAGVVGVGMMGAGVAESILRAGMQTWVCDVDHDAVARLVEMGATAVATPRDLAREVDVVCVVVFDGPQVEDVVLGPAGIVHGARPGTVVCICSTVDDATVRRVHDAALAHDVHVLDAGISGGADRARVGALVTMVGGRDADVDRARPVLVAFSAEVIHAGALCAGMHLKLVKNLVSYLVLCGVHEGLAFAEELGISAETARHVFAASHLLDDFFHFATSRPSARPLGADADPAAIERARFFARVARKDLESAAAVAREIGIDLPAARVARERADAYFLVPEFTSSETWS
jgi:3-hydroxyisobutyrate dehydrogenase-like beta-hydroxyacid dehydrogenase